MNEAITITAGIKDDTASQLWPSNIRVNHDIARKDPEQAISQAIIAEADKYISIVISDKKSYEIILEGLSIFRTARTSIEKRRLELGEDHKKYINLLNLTAKKLTAMITPVEDQLKAKRKSWDDAQEAIKQEAERKEAARVASIQAKIEAIRGMVPAVPTSSDALSEILFDINTMVIGEDFQEFQGQAEAARAEASAKADQLMTDRLKWEKEESDRKEALAKLEAVRIENDRIEAERKAKAEAEEKTRRDERKAFEAEKRTLAEEREKIEAVKREEQERIETIKLARFEMLLKVGFTYPFDDLGTMTDHAFMYMFDERNKAYEKEQNRIFIENLKKERKDRAEFEKAATEKAEREVKERMEREEDEHKAKADAEVAEAARQEALKPDREKLLAFANKIEEISADYFPQVSAAGAKEILRQADLMLVEVRNFILSGAEEL